MNKIIKGATKSKTIWFNILIAALVSLEGAFPLLQPALGLQWYGILLTVLTVGNVILRGITTTALAEK